MNLRQIKNPGLLPKHIILPEHDVFGILTGHAYEQWHPASRSKRGKAGNWKCIKTNMTVGLHSGLEEKALRVFDFHPRVVDIRPQYPFWCAEEYEKYQRSGKRFPKSKVATDDFMLTVVDDEGAIRYHGVSVKPSCLLDTKEVKDRHRREQEWCHRWGMTWEVLTEKDLLEQEYFNHLALRSYFGRRSTIPALYDDALDYAKRILATSARGDLNHVLKCASWNTIPLRKCYELFAAAVLIGALKVDNRYQVGEYRELHLVR